MHPRCSQFSLPSLKMEYTKKIFILDYYRIPNESKWTYLSLIQIRFRNSFPKHFDRRSSYPERVKDLSKEQKGWTMSQWHSSSLHPQSALGMKRGSPFPHLTLLVEQAEGLLQRRDGDEHVLDQMVLLVQFLHRRALRQFHE